MLGNMRSNKATALVVGVVIFLAAFVGLAYNHLEPWQRPNADTTDTDLAISEPEKGDKTAATTAATVPETTSTPSPDTSSADALKELRTVYLEQLMKLKFKPGDESIKNYGVFEAKLPTKPYFTEGLGEKLCIIDMDSRPFDEPGQIFSEDGMTWDDAETVHGLSLGLLNHWVFAKIHGYKYYYVNTVPYEDRRDSWKKPPIMSALLKNHETCIFLDSDAVFNRLDVPFEWLMNYWEINSKNNSLALAADPNAKENQDKFGKVYLNTGFIVAQNNEKTFEIFDEWQDCPNDGGRHPECSEFKKNRPGKPTDQGGFGTYIRYDYPKDIKELKCTEANGFPESHSGCEGTYIKHLWTGKSNHIKVAIGQQLPGDLLAAFHSQFLKEKKDFFISETDLLSQK